MTAIEFTAALNAMLLDTSAETEQTRRAVLAIATEIEADRAASRRALAESARQHGASIAELLTAGERP